MRLSGQAYSNRLAKFSRSTLQLLVDVRTISREMADKASDITTDSELSEEEVVERLKALLEYSRKTGR